MYFLPMIGCQETVIVLQFGYYCQFYQIFDTLMKNKSAIIFNEPPDN